jgi:hypothetical protein
VKSRQTPYHLNCAPALLFLFHFWDIVLQPFFVLAGLKLEIFLHLTPEQLRLYTWITTLGLLSVKDHSNACIIVSLCGCDRYFLTNYELFSCLFGSIFFLVKFLFKHWNFPPLK